MEFGRLTHFTDNGDAAQVDITGKMTSCRAASAYGEVRLNPEIVRLIRTNKLAKGHALNTAKVAGILAAKRVDTLIPLCHSIHLDWVDVAFEFGRDSVRVRAEAKSEGRTGVEMEAMTAVSVACLTLYDMAKSVDKGIVIGPIYLVSKSGGKSGNYHRNGKLKSLSVAGKNK